MRPRLHLTLLFVTLFFFYQLPEGMRLLLPPSAGPIAQAALMVFFHVVAYFVGRRMGHGGFGAFAMERYRGFVRNLVSMLLLAIMAKLAAVLVGSALGVYTLSKARATPTGALVHLAQMGALCAMMYFPSAAEDIVTRGFFFRVLPSSWSALRFVLFSSTVYVLNHIYRLKNGPLEWTMLFAFGLAYATALVRSRSLWSAIGLHVGWNIASDTVSGFLPWDVQVAWASPLLSAGAHLGIAALLLAAPGILVKNEENAYGPGSMKESIPALTAGGA